jgi:hypothetical protein
LVTASTADDRIEVAENGSSNESWTLRKWSCRLSERARNDGGERFGREEVEVAWAVPRSSEAGRTKRQLWSFLPLQAGDSGLPGILNGGWKLGTDRVGVVQGELNEELLAFAAKDIVRSLPGLADPQQPGHVLDYLPRRQGTYMEAWAARDLRTSIWEVAPSAEIVPSQAGTWRLGKDVKIWPEELLGLAMRQLRRRWAERVPDPGDWLHETALAQDRVDVVRSLGAGQATLGLWLEALRDDGDPVGSSFAALNLATDLLGSAEEGVVRTVSTWVSLSCIVLTETGRWRMAGDIEIARDAPDAENRPHVDLAAAVEHLQERLGLSADVGEHRLAQFLEQYEIELAEELPEDLAEELAEELWSLVHELGERSIALLSQRRASHIIPVRTVSGAFKTVDEVLRPGRILKAEEDPEVTIDMVFHRDDEGALQAIGDSVVSFKPRALAQEPPCHVAPSR